jgi:hypothetical protein
MEVNWFTSRPQDDKMSDNCIINVHSFVIPAKAGIQKNCIYWIPAYAGMERIQR